MPSIKDYSSQVEENSGLSTQQATPSSFGADIAQGANQLGEGLQRAGSVVYQRAQQGEVSDANADTSLLFAKKQQQLKEAQDEADPNDPSWIDDFMDTFHEDLDAVKQKYRTNAAQNYLNKSGAKMERHFLDSAAAGQRDLVQTNTIANYHTSLNNYASQLMQNPGDFDTVQELHAEGLDALVDTHDLDQKSKIDLLEKGQTQLAQAAMRGWISLNPEYAREQLDKGWGSDFLNSEQRAALEGHADQAIRGIEAEKERQEKFQEKMLHKQQMVTQDDFLSKLQDGKLTWKEVEDSNLDAFGQGSKEVFRQLMVAHNRDSLEKSDPTVVRNLLRRISLPDGDPQKLTDERDLLPYTIRGQVGKGDLQWLRSEVQGRRTQEGRNEAELEKQFMKIVHDELSKSNEMAGIKDPEGDTQVLKFLQAYFPAKEAARKKGIPIMGLIDPKSPNYLGGTFLDQYRNSPEQIMNSMAGGQQYGPPTPIPSFATGAPADPPPSPRVLPPAAPEEERVDVISPRGKHGRIPKAQLKEALKQGYKQP